MISKEQIEKNREKIRLKLENERKRKESEAKKKAEEKRLKQEKEEKLKEREDLAIRIAEKIKPTEIPKVQKIKFPEVETIKGKQGDRGEKGDSIKGDRGESIKGDKGDKGDFVKGDKGDRGNKGESIKGDKGDNGKDADEEKIVKEVLKKIPEQPEQIDASAEIEKLQKKMDEIKEDLETAPKHIYGARGLLTVRAGSGISIDEDELAVGRPIISVTPNAGTIENLSSQCDGSTTVITTASNTGIIWLTLNGTMLVEGKEFTRDSATQITLTFAPETGEELYLKYL